MATTTVIIVNYNSGDLVQQCLDCLSRQTLQPTHIVVIDNASSDGSIQCIKEMPNLMIQLMESNLGFARANNQAIRQCDTDLVVLLNPDAFPEPEWLERLVEAACNHPEVAAFGSRQMVYDKKGRVDGLGDVYHLSSLVWRRGHGQRLEAIDGLQVDIFSACAGAALYRTEAIKAVAGFDEDFFCYVEDVDLGFRMRLVGFKAILVPDAVVHHVGSATTGGQHSDFAVYHGHRNLVWTYVKNMPNWLFWPLLPLHLFMNIVAIGWFVMRGQGGVILRAKRDAIFGLPLMWRKRKMIQRNSQVSTAEIWQVLDKRLWLRKRVLASEN